MSVETTFLNVKSITISPVQTFLCFESSSTRFFTQRVMIRFSDGSEHGLTLFLPAGQPALALGELVTHEQVTA
ncbi:hypothetical protein BCF11_3413 [Collimonas sp. PA-H2]|uniref:hypothetical protein n=1 Tax=Collimonas sp. PA-H2 TaxID=1881062 RepID=UPI000BF9DE80|nr:hypothetical protein [Collimonas sp. PA-H2]PFH10975.1 hypothetical protein BCF11_3413 [Collimonas sp. PA-H2]